MKAFPIVYHRWRDDNLVENLPIGLVFQCSFKTQTNVFTKQIDEATFLQLTGMSRPQHVVNARVGGAVVQVTHHDDFRLITFGGYRHDGVDFCPQNRC